jgi:hypothetical protein
VDVSAPLEFAAFDSLRAEDEPWLLDCFVPPPDFDLMAGSRSAVILGDEGSGKSAVATALRQRAQGRYLVVAWQPAPSIAAPTPWRDARSQVEQVLGAVAWALLEWLGEDPGRYSQAAGWAQGTFHWVARYALLDATAERGLLPLAEASPSMQSLIAEFLQGKAPQIAPPQTPPVDVMRLLLRALRSVGLQGVWIVADGLGAHLAAAPEEVARSLRAFLATLPIFEQAGCIYKLMVPSELSDAVLQSDAAWRARVDPFRLQWLPEPEKPDQEPPTDPLRALVERRLALALGRARASPRDLCDADGFEQWLYRVGGGSPRGWLSALRPLVAAYFERLPEERRPLTAEEWRAIRRRHPPSVRLLPETRSLQVGGRIVEGFSESEWLILRILYERRGQLVTRKEIYRALFPHDPELGSLNLMRSVVDTALWRLRKAIEPIPQDPTLILTQRDQGVRLRVL